MLPVQSSDRTLRAQAAKDLSTSFAELLPAEGPDIGRFLFESAYALCTSEADLARHLGVSHATLSSWKRRGSIPEPHLAWFSRDFVVALMRSDPPKQHEGIRHVGIEVALAVYKQTDFDPFRNLFDSEARRVEVCFRNISPISRLGLFVLRRLELQRGEVPFDDFLWNQVTPKVIELARLASVTLSH